MISSHRASTAAYDTRSFVSDVRGGAAACLVTLPVALGVAACSGAPPERGVYATIVGGFVASLVSSESQLAGPSLLLAVSVSSVIADYGLSGAALCTLMAGAMLLFLERAGLTRVLEHLPQPPLDGMRQGLALALGISVLNSVIGEGRGNDRIVTVLTLVLALIVRRWAKRAGAAVALAVGGAISWVLHTGPPPLANASHSALEGPIFRLPSFDMATLEALILPSLAIAVIIAAEPAPASGTRLSGERPSVMMGLANLAASFMGGLPVTRGVIRASGDIRANPRTPVAGVIHAVALAGALAMLAPLVCHVSVAVLYGIVLGELVVFGGPSPFAIRSAPGFDRGVWTIGLLTAAVLPLPVAVAIAVVASAILVERRRPRPPRCWVN